MLSGENILTATFGLVVDFNVNSVVVRGVFKVVVLNFVVFIFDLTAFTGDIKNRVVDLAVNELIFE